MARMGSASLPLHVDSYQTLTNDRAVPRENKRRTKKTVAAMARINFLNLARNFDRLATADAIIADSYLRYILRRSALFVVAGTISLASFAAVEVSLFWTFQPTLGPITAGALIAAVNCILSFLLFALAARFRPGPTFTLAVEMRRSATEALERDLSPPATQSEPLSYPVKPAIDVLVSAVLVPMVAAFVHSLGRSRGHDVDTVKPEV
ncbi:MAG: hypothetical protein ACKVP3_16930 [Hyphomicrobiaceae bacterium]